MAGSGVAREEVFLTTKLWTTDLAGDRVGPALGASLRRLRPLRWLIEQDHVAAIPKATSPARIEENLGAVEVELGQAEMRRIGALERGQRLIAPSFAPDWEE